MNRFISICVMLFLLPSVVLARVDPHSNHRITPIVKAVKKASPSVVSISALQVVNRKKDPFGVMRSRPNPFSKESDFNKQNFLGSGVIINPQGYILTNEHVIAQGSLFRVTLADKRQFDAVVQGADKDLDLAILKIRSQELINLPQIKIGTSRDLMIGETVIAIGNPFGLSQTVTTGVISATSRNVRSGKQIYRDFIQVDAPIHSGNSGGPLLNINGELIGITTAVLENAYGIGFAIPINQAMRVVEDLIQYGEIRGVWFGIALQENPSLQNGLFIVQVDPEGPAFQVGIRPGDILQAIEGKKIRTREEYLNIIRSYTVNNIVPLQIKRQEKVLGINVKASEFPLDRALPLAKILLGIEVQDITARMSRRYKLQNLKGVLIRRVQSKKPASKIGLRPGDIIRQIDNRQISNLEEFKKAILRLRLRNSALFLIQRGSFGYYVTLRLDLA